MSRRSATRRRTSRGMEHAHREAERRRGNESLWPIGTRVETIVDLRRYRTGEEVEGPVPAGTRGEVVRGDLFAGKYVQVRFDDEQHLIRLVERYKLAEVQPEKGATE